MALTSANVRVAVTGKVYRGVTTADVPTAVDSALDTDLHELGYVGEDGLTESRERTSTDIKAWQNSAVVRTVVTDAKYTIKFTLIETTKENLETYYGTATASEHIALDPSATGGRFAWVFDVVDGTSDRRIYLPEGEVTEVGDTVYKNGEPIGYELTVTGYPVSARVADIWDTVLEA